LVDITAEIVSAFVSNNTVQSSQIPEIIKEVHNTLQTIYEGSEYLIDGNNSLKPAANPKKSIFPDYIICLEDGQKFKSLKRHLMTHYKMSPEEYRAKWNLPSDYPMVAPNYAEARSALAKKIGLGHTPRGLGKKNRKVA
jgi:predicted transcriptional regulator